MSHLLERLFDPYHADYRLSALGCWLVENGLTLVEAEKIDICWKSWNCDNEVPIETEDQIKSLWLSIKSNKTINDPKRYFEIACEKKIGGLNIHRFLNREDFNINEWAKLEFAWPKFTGYERRLVQRFGFQAHNIRTTIKEKMGINDEFTVFTS